MLGVTIPGDESTLAKGERLNAPLRLGNLTLASRYCLSPLAGYTNMPFRVAVRELGGLGLATTELVSTRALLMGSAKTSEYIETCAADSPLAVQIYGSDAKEMCDAAQWLENYGAAAIDINMGCPVAKVVKNGGGSAMMCNIGATTALVRAVVEAVRIPVTVKMRLGWDDTNHTAPSLAREFEQAGVAAVTIHGRTREQGFSGKVNIDGIRAVVESVERMPIIGNGDVRSIADAERMFRETGCAAIGIGRGALLNPWIFAQLCSWATTGDVGFVPTYDQRLDFMTRHYYLLVEQRGERYASLVFRKCGGWYSRVLKPGREIHQKMMMLECLADFDAIVATLREKGPPPTWKAGELPEIAVPKGPISHW
ncbi:MAG: tRNA dihydrouridine synthase DusB [Planctomycetes bacterium]|nr:tRNA dihydrouridine synthase DusB [Planctomycetota bacterium]